MAMLRTRCPVLALALLGGVLWAEPALASGFSTARFGGEHGTPVTTNPTAIYYNPAGIAESTGVHIFLDGNIAFRAATWTHAPEATDDVSVPGANDGEATLFNVVAAPMLGASAKLGDLAIGGGFYVPFGGSATWDQNEAFEGDARYPGPLDGVQRWHSISGSIQSMYFTLAGAYDIKSIGLSLGVSGNLISSSVKTLRARTASSDNTVAAEGRSLIDVSGLQFSAAFGAMLEAVPEKLWIGASYQAAPNFSGKVQLDGTLVNNLSGTPDAPVDVTLHQGLPDVIRLGVRFAAAEGMELRLHGDYTRWSLMDRQCLTPKGKECQLNEDGSSSAPPEEAPIVNLPRGWNDAFGVRAGLSYWPTESAELFSGIGYDSNAIPDETLDPSIMDYDDVSVGLGGRFAIGDHLHLAASYTHFFAVQRDTTGKSTIDDKPIPSRSPDAGGLFTQTIGVVNLNLDVGF
jgi:long-chain fatty acid transport protein